MNNHLILDRKVRVKVWHRTDEDAWLRGWDKQPDFPRLAFAYEYEIDVADLSEDYPHENCGLVNSRICDTEQGMPVMHNTRSLAVGDVVEIELPNQTVFWGVARLANRWERVTEQQVADAKRREQAAEEWAMEIVGRFLN